MRMSLTRKAFFLVLIGISSLFFAIVFISRTKSIIDNTTASTPTTTASSTTTTTTTTSATTTAKNSDDFIIDLGRGYWQGLAAQKRHLYDKSLAQAMVKFFNDEKAHLLADFGAGLGKYAEILVKNGFFVTCLDGNPRTQDLSNGRCSSMDLSKPVRISLHEWVISLEVGEHIPPEFESTFLQNLDSANKYGLVLSWAIKGQGGNGHFNNQNNSYIIQKLETEYKYKFDQVSADLLRNKTSFPYFRKTLMVFRKEPKSKENPNEISHQ